MKKKSLGMLEVRGLLGSIVAADTALKTSEVHLVKKESIRGGLTSIELFGDVGAVTEAISSAKEAVREMNCYISSNIIANLDPQVEKMILDSIEEKTEKKNIDKKPLNENRDKYMTFLSEIEKENITDLSDLKVTELRSLAYSMEIESLSKKEIKYATKDILISNLKNEGIE